MQTPPQHQDTAVEVAEREPAEPWLEDLGELPPRPRRRLLSPAPLALLAVLIAACGFIGGVLVEKGQSGGSSGSGPSGAFASRLRALTAGASGSGSSRANPFGGAGVTGPSGVAGSGARPTSGTVSFASGKTLYVTDAEGNTVKVQTSAGTSVTKTVKASVHSIRPGENVTVTGATAADGTVKAESVRVGSTGGLTALFSGATGAPSSPGAPSATGGSSNASPPLFGGG